MMEEVYREESPEWEEVPSGEYENDWSSDGESEEYTEDSSGEDDGYTEDSSEEDEEESGEPDTEEADTGEPDLRDRLDSLLEQIGHEKSYGTMGDYYVREAGCYAFPSAEVFSHFVDVELEGAGWTEASNGCIVPVEYLESYEAYLSGSSGEEQEGEETGELPGGPSVSLEDFNRLKELLLETADRDASFYESVLLHQEQNEEALEQLNDRLAITDTILVTLAVLCALLAGHVFAHAFFGRMRVG